MSGPALLIYVIVGAVLIVAAVWLVPQWIVVGDAGDATGTKPLTTAQRVDAITTTRQLMLLAAGGLLAIVGIVFTWRRDRTARALADLERDANFTTRYTEAIAQLGDRESLAIRLGGIYALERIAGDSTRDRQTILDVLAAYLRTQSPALDESDSRPKLLEADVEAAATVLGRVTQISRPKHRTNLHGAYLAGATLSGANLDGARLDGAFLDGANLAGANLDGAILEGARLLGVRLGGATLVGAFLNAARLDAARLSGADRREPSRRDPGRRVPDRREPDRREPDPRHSDPREADPRVPDRREAGRREPDRRQPDRREPDRREPR